MTRNVGGIDRTIRIIAGAVLLLLGILMDIGTGWRAGFLVVALIALTTAFVRF